MSADRRPGRVTVVIPTLNAASTLPAQLDALARQDYTGDVEVLVADNGSLDGSVDVARRRAPDVRLIAATGMTGVSAARNAGTAAATGDLVLFCDADDVAGESWLRAMVEAAASADLVGGRLEPGTINPARVLRWREAPHPPDQLPTALGHLPYAVGANIGVWRDVLVELGGFDESLRSGGDDVDLAWRAQQLGYTVAFAPGAIMHYRYRHDVRGTLTQAWRYGVADAALYRRYRTELTRPRPRHLLRAYLRLASAARALLAGPDAAIGWLRQLCNRLGRLHGSWVHRVFYP